MVTFLTETSHSLLLTSLLLFYCFDKIPEKKRVYFGLSKVNNGRGGMPAGSSEILSSTIDIKQRVITGNKARHRLSNHVPNDVLPPSGLHLPKPCPSSSTNSKLSSAGAYGIYFSLKSS